MANQTTPNLPDLIRSNKEKILSVAIPSIQKNSEIWLQRSIVEVSQNKDIADYVASSPGAATQFINKLAKAAQVGLQIGGTKPHCYFIKVPVRDKQGNTIGHTIRMDITKDGYSHAAVYGPGSVLAHIPEFISVHEKEIKEGKFRINQAEGTVYHDYNPFDPDRGKVVGWYCILTYKNGRIEIPHITVDKVEKIQKNYGNLDSQAYKKSKEEMDYKTVAKQLLKKPFAESEGLALQIDALDVDGIDDTPPETKDITDRAETRIDDALGNLGEGNEIEPPTAKKEKVVNEKPKADLF